MSGLIIRDAVREDCPRIMELVKELALYERAADEVTVDPVHFIDSGFGGHPVWWAKVAVMDDVIVGFALWYVRYSTWKGQRLYLEDLYVVPAMRRYGVGSELFRSLVEECTRRKFSGMAWQALEWNEPALEFYEKYGAKLDPEWINCSLEMT